ncbi:MAG: gluconeogenesis factor YvcK family protein [Candidatus Levyibacteriota bacterium]
MEKNVVVIGGGTGVFTVLTGLKKYPYNLSAIVSMADDGGSTGLLREEFGTLPPGDIRRALVALSHTDNKIISDLFNYRFKSKGVLSGHSLGNLLLTALEKITGSFDQAVKEAVKILNVEGQVIPVTLKPTFLHAELEDGEIIVGETNIDIPKHDGSVPIKRVFLEPKVSANPEAVQAIKEADFVILGPGDLYTSILPNLITQDVVEALNETSAKVIYVVNIMTKYGETCGFTASDFVRVIKQHLGKTVVDYCIINTEMPTGEILKRYEEDKEEPVKFDAENFNNGIKVITGEFLRKGKFLRHNPQKLAKALSSIIEG